MALFRRSTCFLLVFESTLFLKKYIHIATSLYSQALMLQEARILSDFIFSRKEMYASVKVRANKQDGEFSLRNDGESLLILGIKDSLSIRAEDNQSHSPPSLARITKAHVPKFRSQSISAFRGTVKNNGHTHKNTKSNISANSVPRPRAVLSSPDNDGMIGSRNKLMEEKFWHSSTKEKMPAQNKVKAAARPLNTKNSKEVSDNKSSLKQRKLHEHVVLQKEKPRLIEGKPSPNAI